MNNLSALFVEAGTLLLAGMCFVFIFLGLLVLVINYVLTPLAEKFPDQIATPTRKASSSNKLTSKGVSPQVVAAISSAVASYRKKNNQQ